MPNNKEKYSSKLYISLDLSYLCSAKMKKNRKNLKKKAPRFLLESRTLAGSVIAIVLFSIIFMLIYGPYSSTSWLTLMAGDEQMGNSLLH